MGAACCVASKDRTIQSGSTNEISHRNIRYSPTWSFRWDHRGRVAGEDTSINWFSDGISRNDGSENKNESALVSADGSPSHNCQRNRCGKSPISEGTAARVRHPTSGNFHEDSFLISSMDLLFRIGQLFCISFYTYSHKYKHSDVFSNIFLSHNLSVIMKTGN